MRSYPVLMRYRSLFFSVLVLSFNLSTSYGIELTDTTDKIQIGTHISIVGSFKSKDSDDRVRFYQGQIVDKNHKPSHPSGVYCFLAGQFSGDFQFSSTDHGVIGTNTAFDGVRGFFGRSLSMAQGLYCYNINGDKFTVGDILDAVGDHIQIFPPTSSIPLNLNKPPSRSSDLPALDSDSTLKLPAESRLVLKQDLKIDAHDNQIRFFQGQAVDPRFDSSHDKSLKDAVHADLWVKEVKKTVRMIPSKPPGESCNSRSCLQLGKARLSKLEATIDGKKKGVPGTMIPIEGSNNFASLVCYKPSGEDVTIGELKAAFSDVLAFYEEPPSNEIEISHEEHKVNFTEELEESDEGRSQEQGILAPHPSFAPQQGAGIGSSPSAPPGGPGTL